MDLGCQLVVLNLSTYHVMRADVNSHGAALGYATVAVTTASVVGCDEFVRLARRCAGSNPGSAETARLRQGNGV